MALLIGIVVGAVCAAPMLYALRAAAQPSPHLDMARLLACALLPFMLLQAVLVGVWRVFPHEILGFGSGSALGLLFAVVWGLIRGRNGAPRQ